MFKRHQFRRVKPSSAGLGYTQVATSLRFTVPAVTLNGPPGTTYTDAAKVYDQFGALMSPQTGSVSYVSGTVGVATVGASTALITSVTDGTSIVTATWVDS